MKEKLDIFDKEMKVYQVYSISFATVVTNCLYYNKALQKRMYFIPHHESVKVTKLCSLILLSSLLRLLIEYRQYK